MTIETQKNGKKLERLRQPQSQLPNWHFFKSDPDSLINSQNLIPIQITEFRYKIPNYSFN